MKPVEKKHGPKMKKAFSESSPNSKPEEALSASTSKLKTTSNSVVRKDLHISYENCGKLQVYSLGVFFSQCDCFNLFIPQGFTTEGFTTRFYQGFIHSTRSTVCEHG